jgi:hypothetical protein
MTFVRFLVQTKITNKGEYSSFKIYIQGKRYFINFHFIQFVNFIGKNSFHLLY